MTVIFRSPSQLAKRLTCLQESEAVMLERQGQLQSRCDHINPYKILILFPQTCLKGLRFQIKFPF